MNKHVDLKKISNECYQVAKTILDISYRAQTGHVGSALSISDLISVLYFSRLNVNKSDWGKPSTLLRSSSSASHGSIKLTTSRTGPSAEFTPLLAGLRTGYEKNNFRDRFILSKGHAAAALYAALFHKGIISRKELDSFGRNEGGLCEHPEIFTPGVEMTSGSLGHGLAFGAGIAWGLKLVKNEKLKVKSPVNKKIKAQFKSYDFKPYSSAQGELTTSYQPPHVFVLISDGECGEGSVWEAALFASRMRLDNLTVILDNNGWQCFGKTDKITHLRPLKAKWKAFGFAVREIDGHDLKKIYQTYREVPFETGKPSIIIAETVTGHGVKLIENTLEGHFKVFQNEEYLEAVRNIKDIYL